LGRIVLLSSLKAFDFLKAEYWKLLKMTLIIPFKTFFGVGKYHVFVKKK